MRTLSTCLLLTAAASLGCNSQPVAPGSIVIMTGNPRPSISATAVGCVPAQSRADLHLVVTTGSSVFVDQVLLHMNDGTNLGGSSVTIPRSQLNVQFGDTLVLAGTSRAFGFPSVIVCAPVHVQPVRTEVTLVNPNGARQLLTANVTLP
jgi:hypothetical protein